MSQTLIQADHQEPSGQHDRRTTPPGTPPFAAESWLRRYVGILGIGLAVLVIVAVGIAARLAGPHPAGYVNLAENPADPPLTVAAAPARTTAAGTASVTMRTTGPGSTPLQAAGLVDFDTARSIVTLPGGTRSLTRGGTSWLQRPGAGWRPTQTDPNRTLTLVGSVHPVDPLAALRLLTAVSSSTTRLKTGDVDGTPVSHYRAVLDFNRTAAQNVLDPALLTGLRTQVGGRPSVSVEVWLDADGRVRRLRLPTRNAASLTIEFARFGERAALPTPN